MAEKITEVLERYGVHATSIKRGRGAFFCHAPEGYFVLEPFSQSISRLEKMYRLKELLYDAGFTGIDRYRFLEEPEEDGETETSVCDRLIAEDRYHNSYIMKTCFDGHECDLKNEEDVRLAIGNLRRLHQTANRIPELQCGNAVIGVTATYFKHNQEMKRVRNYIRDVHKKQEFENRYQELFPYYFAQAQLVTGKMEACESAMQDNHVGLCHGAYHQHNVIITDAGVATVCFEHAHFQNQLLDFYQFTRKLLEKNHYMFSIFHHALEVYAEGMKLSEQDYAFLFLLFSYPEKFWKLSNRYMNSRKAWIPPKMLEKLQGLEELEQEKQVFLQLFGRTYGIPFS